MTYHNNATVLMTNSQSESAGFFYSFYQGTLVKKVKVTYI